MTEADHFAQALAAHVPTGAWRAAWMARHAGARPGQADGSAACAEAGAAMSAPIQVQAGADGAASAGGTVRIAEARPKPVPPPQTPAQRDAALAAARQLNSERKALRAALQAGELTLAELLGLARSDQAAGRMPTRTALMALSGVRTARAARLMAEAGIHGKCRAGALTDRQRDQLVAAVAALHGELATRQAGRAG